MRRESYLLKPPMAEIYPVFSGTDIILRKNLELVEKEETQGEEKTTYEAWECDEVQFHYNGEVVLSDIMDNFDYWYEKADAAPDTSSVEGLSLEDARVAKYHEIAAACEQTIYAGVDVSTSSGVEHFALTEKDQINLFGKKDAAAGVERRSLSITKTDSLVDTTLPRICRASSIRRCCFKTYNTHTAMH